MTAMGEISIRRAYKSIEELHRLSMESLKNKNEKILILGLGNTILTDDGVGIYVSREIKKKIKNKSVTVQEASVGGLELLDTIQGFNRLILIDAVVTGKHAVGSLIKMMLEDLKGGSAMTRHHVGLTEALELGKRLNMDLPETISIYGIEVKETRTFGESCSPELALQIPHIAEKIIRQELPE